MFWVYIIENPAGKLYVGQTDDLSVRLSNHNRVDRIAGKFTRKNGPRVLIWKEEHPTRASAVDRERQIKAMKSARWIRSQLLKLLEDNNRPPKEGVKKRRFPRTLQ